MAITNLYPNLPGHLVEFKDGGMQLVTQDEQTTGTKSLLILGTALDGPVMEPVRIDAETVSQLFGSDVDADGYPNGATLTKYAKQAFRNGFGDVRCMRVTGSSATVEIEKGTSAVVGTSEQINLSPALRLYYASVNKIISSIKEDFAANGTPAGFIVEDDITIDTERYRFKSTSNATVDDNNVVKPNGFLLPGAVINIELQEESVVSGAAKQMTSAEAEDPENAGNFKAQLVFEFDLPVLQNLPGTRNAQFAAYDANDNPDVSNFSMVLSDASNASISETIATQSNITVDMAAGKVIFTIDMSARTTTFTSLTDLSYVLKTKIVDDSTVVSYTVDQKDIVDGNGAAIFDGSGNYVVPVCTLDDIDGSGISNTAEGTYAIGPVAIWTPKDAIPANAISFQDGTAFTATIAPLTGGAKPYGANIILNVSQYNELANSRFGAQSVDQGINCINLPFTYKTGTKSVSTEKITVGSIYGGSVYNGNGIVSYNAPVNGNAVVISKLFADDGVTDIGRRFTFYKSEEKKYSTADKPFYFDSTVCPTIGRMREALAKYQYNNVFQILPDKDDLLTNDFPEGVYFLGGTIVYPDGTTETGCGTVGTDGINPTNNEMFEALAGKRDAVTRELVEQGAYQLLENYHVDFIYPAGVYADETQTVDPHSSFHNELAMCCAALTYRTKMTHGFIDVKPNTNTTLKGVQKYVNDLMNYDTVLYIKDRDGNELVDSNGEKMEIGWYTSLVVGPEPIMSSDTLGTFYGSPAIAYAALCGLLAPQSAPTNKALTGVSGLKFKFSNKQMDMLTAKHMITFKLKGEGTSTASSTPYVVDGCTCGSENCDYRRMSTVKIVTDVVDQIRQVCDPFIGEPNSREQKNAMSALVSKLLSNDMTAGEITSYSFSIEETLDELISGRTRIMLELTVPMELRLITTVVALRAGI